MYLHDSIITGIRMGFACNSSSTHSIVLVPNGMELLNVPTDGDFGWDDFTLTTESEKRDYLAAMLHSNRQVETVEEANTLTGGNIDEHAYVDHQSVFNFPLNANGSLNREFLSEYVEWIATNPKINILGGNDNSEGHPDTATTKALETLGGADIAKRNGNSWVLFDPITGNRRRLNFNGDTQEKGVWPELVDLKITDACQFGCKFCYQGSTPKGRVASIEEILTAIDMCAEMGVLELAIGGGEPTNHPEFELILSYAREKGMVPNFTTRNLSYLLENETWRTSTGAAAYSVDTKAGLMAFVKAIEATKDEWRYRNSTVVQIVVGVQSEQELSAMLEYASAKYLRVTLLGYKTTGFGSNVTPYEYDLISVLQKLGEEKTPELGVDSVLAAKYGKALQEKLNVDIRCIVDREGSYSMYMDAVTGYAHRSSFEEDMSKAHSFRDLDTQALLKAFSAW